MKTEFPKMPANYPLWGQYFRAGEQWLRTYELVRQARDNFEFHYYVEPHALAFAMELLTKARAARANPRFSANEKGLDGKRLGHRTTAIIEAYAARIPTFEAIVGNKKLLDLIQVYEQTIDTRFGQTGVSWDGDDAKLIFDAAESLWDEIDTDRKADK